MNQRLKNILNKFERNKKLTKRESELILKELIKTNEKLKKSAVKLEKKEKEKKSTATLLKKTIKKLEQKQKALEAHKRKLAIEAALEKVRKIAMGMRKPVDMLNVCKTISLQLQSLGVKEIRNVQTAIFYEQRGTYMNYEYYAKHNKTFITETVYTNHKIHNEFATKMIKGKGEVFITHIKNKKVKKWIAYQKTTNVFIDKYLETASSLNYYWFSLGPVALGNSTYHPLTEEETNLFKRFLKVFELAYRRYLDIEQAEAQAREARIEAVLERVRSQSLAMHESKDLEMVITILLQQLEEIGILLDTASIVIPSKDKKTSVDWTASKKYKYSKGFIVPLLENGKPALSGEINRDMVAALKSGKEFTKSYSKKEKNIYFQNLFDKSGFSETPEERKEFLLSLPGISVSTAVSKNSYIQIFSYSGEELSSEDLAVLKRFAMVFEQCYVRFQDLEKAEAQAREAQIEASLERVRAVAMSMHTSDDLLSICEISFKEFQKLGFENLRNAIIHVLYDQEKFFMDYDYSKRLGGNITKLRYDSHPIVMDYFKQIRSAEDAFAEVVIKDDHLKSWKKFRRNTGQHDDPRLEKISALYYYGYSIGIGAIGISTFKPIDKSQIKILKRFRNVFDLTYRRYNDIALAEMQARESQIQLALERVRARTMAMQKSDELAETAGVLFKQMESLGIVPKRSVISIINQKTDKARLWSTTSDGKVIPGFDLVPLTEEKHLINVYSAWKNKEVHLAFKISGNDRLVWTNYVMNKVKMHLPEYQPDKINTEQLLKEPAFFNCFFFTQGFIMVHTAKYLSDDYIPILKRFAGVFEQTYTRFLDLKNAEKQAKESKIEAALERVRSRSMAMHHTSELQDVINTVHQQFKSLDMDITGGAFIAINKENENEIACWGAGGTADYVERVQIPYFNRRIYTGLIENIQKGPGFYTEEFSYKEKIEFFNHLFKNPPYSDASRERKKEVLSRDGGYTRSCAVSKHTNIFIINHHGRKFSEEENNILIRFGKVFEQSYTRFLDLQKAEAQAREAQIEAALEKVRAVALSLKKSDEMLDIAEVLYKQLLELGFTNIRNAMIDIHNDKKETILDYDYSHDMGRSINLMSYYDHPIIEKKVRQIGSSSDAFFEIILEGQDLQDNIELRLKNGEEEDPRLRKVEQLTYNLYSFGNGAIGISNFGVLSNEQKIVLKRFRNVFAFAYKRYGDLVQAENQARESLIQLALERVRARTMAMQVSDELAETAAIVFKQLIALGIAPNRLYIGIIKDDSGAVEFWITDEDGTKVSQQFMGNVSRNKSLQKMYEGWKKQKKSIIIDMQGDELKEYFQYLSNELHVPFKQGLSQKRRIQNIAYFSKGFIGLASPDTQSDETIDLLERFAAVFNLTYTRFNDLQQAEAQNKIIQAENERKTQELEEARQLQLAMLPKELPQLPNLDIAVYMKTATEVGGDYYDFQVGMDGMLTTVIGDATGHGMKAGTVVTITKSLFNSMFANESILDTFDKISQVIKGMKFRQLAMCLLMMKIRGNRMSMSAAAMPPALIFRARNKTVEEILLKGMPLGTMKKFPYKKIESHLNSGDTILLYSDGLPELANDKGQMFGYDRIQKEYHLVGGKEPEQIVEHLKNSASQWVNGKEPDDDVTFVVIKVR